MKKITDFFNPVYHRWATHKLAQKNTAIRLASTKEKIEELTYTQTN